jgi:hypothetical protein
VFRPGGQGSGQVSTGAKPLNNIRWAPGPDKARILGKGLGDEVPVVK